MLLALGVALTMTGDAVSEVQHRLGAIAEAYGYSRARISVLPTMLIVALDDGEPAGLRTIDSFRALRLDQASEVIHLARRAESGRHAPSESLDELHRILRARPRFGTAARVAAHGVLTVGLGLVIHPAAVDLGPTRRSASWWAR